MTIYERVTLAGFFKSCYRCSASYPWKSSRNSSRVCPCSR